MSLAFRMMYSVGLTPWDHGMVPPELVELVSGLQPGRALDVGCGTGTQALWLAAHGWDVTGIDVVGKAIAKARERAAEQGARATFLAVDAAIDDLDLGAPFQLIVDYGCLHSVPTSTREGIARTYARHAAPGATLIVFGFAPRRGPGPKGVGRDELEHRLGADWTLVATKTDHSTPAPKPFVKNGRPIWYVWQRREPTLPPLS